MTVMSDLPVPNRALVGTLEHLYGKEALSEAEKQWHADYPPVDRIDEWRVAHPESKVYFENERKATTEWKWFMLDRAVRTAVDPVAPINGFIGMIVVPVPDPLNCVTSTTFEADGKFAIRLRHGPSKNLVFMWLLDDKRLETPPPPPDSK
jgi:hypothetical protein